MSEELLVRHCAPTLAGNTEKLKTAMTNAFCLIAALSLLLEPAADEEGAADSAAAL